MIVNNLGTLLYSLIFGREVGQDINGNKFFIHKKRPNKKWVLYKNELDPTLLEVDWQMWLLNKNSLDIPKSEKKCNHGIYQQTPIFMLFRPHPAPHLSAR